MEISDIIIYFLYFESDGFHSYLLSGLFQICAHPFPSLLFLLITWLCGSLCSRWSRCSLESLLVSLLLSFLKSQVSPVKLWWTFHKSFSHVNMTKEICSPLWRSSSKSCFLSDKERRRSVFLFIIYILVYLFYEDFTVCSQSLLFRILWFLHLMHWRESCQKSLSLL